MYRNYCKTDDSLKLFLWIIFLPYIAMLGLVFVFSIIANGKGMGYEQFLSLPIVEMINMIFMQVCLLGTLLVYCWKNRINLTKSTGANKKISYKIILILISISLLLVIFSSPFLNIFEAFLKSIGVRVSSTLGIDLSQTGNFIFIFLTIGILTPFIEEFIFRGVVLQGLRKYGNWFAILISALFFMLLHGNLQQSVYQFLFGLIAGYVVIVTGTIWASILLHLLNNSLVLIFAYLNSMSGTSVKIEMGILYVLGAIGITIATAVLIVYCLICIKNIRTKEGKCLVLGQQNNVALNVSQNSVEMDGMALNSNVSLRLNTINEENGANNVGNDSNTAINGAKNDNHYNYKDFFRNSSNRLMFIIGVGTMVLISLINSFA